MDLRTYLKAAGDETVAARIGVKPRTVASWRRGERMPRPDQARRLVDLSDGALTWSDVYAPPAPATQPEEAQA